MAECPYCADDDCPHPDWITQISDAQAEISSLRAALEGAKLLAVANGTGWDEAIQIGKQAVDECESLVMQRDEVTVRYLAERKRCDTLRAGLEEAQAKITAALAVVNAARNIGFDYSLETLESLLAILEGEPTNENG